MKTIKVRKGWSKYSKPTHPFKPNKPSKIIKTEDNKVINTITIFNGTPISLEDLQIPECVDFSSLTLEIQLDYNSEFHLVLRSIYPYEYEDPLYLEKLKEYESKLVKYNLAKEQFKEELKEWKAWVLQEKDKDTQKRIENAEKLLKKHGKI